MSDDNPRKLLDLTANLFKDHKGLKAHFAEIGKEIPVVEKPKVTIQESINKAATIQLLLESLADGPFKRMMTLQLKYANDWGRNQKGYTGTDEDVLNKVISNVDWHTTVWPNILRNRHPELLNK